MEFYLYITIIKNIILQLRIHLVQVLSTHRRPSFDVVVVVLVVLAVLAVVTDLMRAVVLPTLVGGDLNIKPEQLVECGWPYRSSLVKVSSDEPTCQKMGLVLVWNTSLFPHV